MYFVREVVFNYDKVFMMNLYVFYCGDDGGGVGIDCVDFMIMVFSWLREMFIDLLVMDIDFWVNFDFVFGEWNEDFFWSVYF